MPEVNLLLELTKVGGMGAALYIMWLIVKELLATFKQEIANERKRQDKREEAHTDERKEFYALYTQSTERSTKAVEELSRVLSINNGGGENYGPR